MKTSTGQNNPTANLKIYLIILSALFMLNTHAQAKSPNDSILNVVHKELDQSQQYIDKKESQIQQLKEQLQYKTDLRERFDLGTRLFEEYIPYQYDSAYHYALQTNELAGQLNNQSLKTTAQINLLHCYVAAGLFKEGHELLNAIQINDYPATVKVDYYWLCMRFYINLMTYDDSKPLTAEYTRKALSYCDSVLTYQQPGTPAYAQVEAFGYNYKETDPHKKIEKFHSILNRYKFTDPSYAVIYILLAKEYQATGDNDKAIHYSALSTLYDVRNAIRQTTAKTILGECLYARGEVMFASKCLHASLDDANFYNARHRKIEVNSILPIIEYDKVETIEHQKDRLTLYLILLALFVVALIIALFVIYKQIKKLSAARRSIQQQLDEISLINTKLGQSNTQLEISKKQLEESNVIKDMYIKAMGIENTQYIIVRHNNTNHPHCHIVFNRVDNDGKTISDKNDRYRNEKVCKQLKDRYNLTYGTGKDKVNIQHLKGAEQTKYEIYHAVNNILPKAKNWQQFESLLGKQGISINYKYKGQTDEVQGISFRKGEHCFKGSDIDRQFSYSRLDAILGGNSHRQTPQEQQVQQAPPAKTTGNTLAETIATGVAGTVSGLSGLLDFQPSGYDPDEAEALRQQALTRKKKKKKRKGLRH